MKNDIILLEMEEKHIELVRNWRNSDEISKYMYSDEYITLEMQQIWYARVKSDASQKYWIITYDEKLLGLASLYKIDHVLDSCYWAFYLGDTSIRGAGIGAKVEFNILSYVFDNLKLNKLRCEVLVFNEMVIKMHEKFGFRREAYYREHCKKKGEYLDSVGLAMLKKEWDLLKEYLKSKIYGDKI
jgi:UDP-4-amino-4,6-dideoxy-N-acetyl-beta-L-altrosamine N-acetyltransferase